MSSTEPLTRIGPTQAATETPPGIPDSEDSSLAGTNLLHEWLEIAHELWHARDLLLELTLRDIRVRYKQAVMGFTWAIFMPAVTVLSGCIVRLVIVHLSGGVFDRASFAAVAVKSLPWAFFVGAIGFATGSLTGNGNLITKIYFPREVLPFASILAQSLDSTIGAVVLGIALLAIGLPFNAALVWVPVLALLLFVFTVAMALFLSCANLFFRDVKYIVQVFLTFGVFFTPVFFEPAMLGARAARWMMLNPLAPLLEGFRLAVVSGHNLLVPITVMHAGHAVLAWSPWYLAYTAVWGFVGLAAASILFHRSEFIFAEHV